MSVISSLQRHNPSIYNKIQTTEEGRFAALLGEILYAGSEAELPSDATNLKSAPGRYFRAPAELHGRAGKFNVRESLSKLEAFLEEVAVAKLIGG